MSFISELRERKVVRVGIIYAVAGWGLLQVADILIGLLRLPDWTLRLTLVVIVVCFPLALILSWFFKMTPRGLERELTPTATMSPTSVAVLPFRLEGGDESNEYLADGLTEETLHALARVEALRVPSRRSCFRFKGSRKGIRHAAARLGVRHIVDGTIKPQDDGFVISVELIDARSDSVLWSDTFEHGAGGLISVQHDIARHVTRALRVGTVAEPDRSGLNHRPASAEAFHAYLKGRHALHRGTADGCRRAVSLFEEAIALESDFARAWVGLSLAYIWLARYGGGLTAADGIGRAREAAQRALALDDSLAEAHLALAETYLSAPLDFSAAEASMRRAIELDPTSAEIYIRYGHYLSMLGRTEEAIAARRRAVSLDPLSEPANAGLADTLFLAGRYGEALRELARIEEVAPEYPILHLRARIALAQGHYESALAHIAGERLEWRRLYISAIAHYRLGDRAKARDELAALVERHGKAIALQAAIVHSQFGEFDAAFRWLETAVEQNDPGIVELMADPELEPLRSDARFPRLLREAGFPPPP